MPFVYNALVNRSIAQWIVGCNSQKKNALMHTSFSPLFLTYYSFALILISPTIWDGWHVNWAAAAAERRSAVQSGDVLGFIRLQDSLIHCSLASY